MDKNGGFVAKLRRGVADLLGDPKVRSEARRQAQKLAKDPRVRRAVREWVNRATQWLAAGSRRASPPRR